VSPRVLEVIDAGTVAYAEALAWQRDLAHARIAGRIGHDLLLLLEHPPVITLGRGFSAEHLLEPAGVDVVEIERGGDVTYHGPGQLVGYPILDLRRHRPDLHWYLRTLERMLIDALAALTVPAEQHPEHTGVWTRGRKIASIGIHVKQWITWHGFALNVSTDLSAFTRIVPCGIRGVEMTSVAREAGRAPDDAGLRRDAVAAVVAAFERTFALAAVAAPHAAATHGSRG
jgi:lipoyl(octanoyl) transferase